MRFRLEISAQFSSKIVYTLTKITKKNDQAAFFPINRFHTNWKWLGKMASIYELCLMNDVGYLKSQWTIHARWFKNRSSLNKITSNLDDEPSISSNNNSNMKWIERKKPSLPTLTGWKWLISVTCEYAAVSTRLE